MIDINNFEFEKKGIRFCFRKPALKGKTLKFEYKIVGHEENNHNDGYYCNAEYDRNKKAIRFNAQVQGKKVNGVLLPEEVLEAVDGYYSEQSKIRENEINAYVEKIANGEVLIDFGIVGCDYPYYQAWLRKLPEALKDMEQSLMEKAIKQYGRGTIEYISNSCDYLEEKLKQRITITSEIRKDAVNLQYNKKEQEYHGFNEDVVTDFQLKLSDLIPISSIEKKIEQDIIKQEFKDSIDMQIIKKGKVDDEIYAHVVMTDIKTKESLKFSCRNIFDFGYTINPMYEVAEGVEGGLANKEMWRDFTPETGWYDVRPLTNFEKKCLKYLGEYAPINTEIRL